MPIQKAEETEEEKTAKERQQRSIAEEVTVGKNERQQIRICGDGDELVLQNTN